ncbi:MAG: 16S rRNA processing protein RimM [Acidobacteria bacterium]|nr:16S rRNA processing protein RimM [Acidobacteriota bacterium]
MEPEEPSSFITIARIVRTRGNKGEVLVESLTDFPGRFDILEEVWLEFENGRLLKIELDFTWEHQGRRVLKFTGIDTISSAEKFIGCLVQIPREQAVRLPAGTYFDHDLIGCSVEDTQGKYLGQVEDILRISGNNQLVVKDGTREFLIPAVENICTRISIEKKQILVDPPEGLMDLDQ